MNPTDIKLLQDMEEFFREKNIMLRKDANGQTYQVDIIDRNIAQNFRNAEITIKQNAGKVTDIDIVDTTRTFSDIEKQDLINEFQKNNDYNSSVS
jgi:hypothetical protein